jgi:hypothetical protein
VPPAFVDRLPPIVQLPSDASDSGNSIPRSAAAACAWASVAPASIVIVAFATSSSRTRFMRESDNTIASPALPGVAAPHRLVLPPCGTIGTPFSAQSRTTTATCSGDAGRTTASAAPR